MKTQDGSRAIDAVAYNGVQVTLALAETSDGVMPCLVVRLNATRVGPTLVHEPMRDLLVNADGLAELLSKLAVAGAAYLGDDFLDLGVVRMTERPRPEPRNGTGMYL